MKIETVKIIGGGWLINGKINVPNNKGNRHYKMIQEWFSEGNIPELEYTEQELNDQAKEKDYQEWKTELNIQNENALRAQYELEKGL